MDSISELGRQINISILVILKEVNLGCINPTSARTELNNALGLLAETVTLVDILSQANQEPLPRRWYWVFICGIIRSNLWRYIYSTRSTRTNDVWGDDVLQLFEALPQPIIMQHLFALVTQSLVNLREIESLICDFDDRLQVVTGTGFLIYALQRYGQVLAQLTILKIFGDTEDGRRLLSEDDFQHPKLLIDPSKCTYTRGEEADTYFRRGRFVVSHTQMLLLGCSVALSLSLLLHLFGSDVSSGVI